MAEAFVKDTINLLPDDQEGCAYDIGANHGIYTPMLAKKFKHVYAFEPENNNFSTLTKNVGHLKNVTLEHKVIGTQNGKQQLWKSRNKGGHTISEKVGTSGRWGHKGKDFTQIDSVTLDTFSKDKDIKFIKCDIEGGEDIIFYHAREMLKEQGPVIMLETHDTVDFKNLYNLFVSCGYKCYDVKNQEVKEMTKNNHYLLKKE